MLEIAVFPQRVNGTNGVILAFSPEDGHSRLLTRDDARLLLHTLADILISNWAPPEISVGPAA